MDNNLDCNPDNAYGPLYILGSTGSVGCNALDVAAHLHMPVDTICAHTSVEKLAQQAITANARLAIIADDSYYLQLKEMLLHTSIEARAGEQEILESISEYSSSKNATVVNAIVGAAGLKATIEACIHAKRVCIANKEPLVMAGSLIMELAHKHNTQILPIDSEHSAIFQCLEGHQLDEVDRIILTASGGALRCVKDLSAVTKEQALKHPNWSMGEKITIDSASLMNKALEIIEACHLFQCPAQKIEVLVHPESIIHSMVSYLDGSVIAQLGKADMRTPIQYALTYPHHRDGVVGPPDFKQLASLHFEDVDHQRFPSINLAYTAIEKGGLAPCAMNAANECAVESFLHQQCRFNDIFTITADAVENISIPNDNENISLDEILACDQSIRLELAGLL
ncbi:MAG: 1-deoxy-D-xylulose-5-phosphate reductoisomerase [Planctomycetes bacterium]|nr:1-deoxy-D-xylulose-5-phosphate reductoisomerase [Planctomycetota bacterium]